MAHLLLIDDDKSLREILAMTLEQAGHVVREAKDGRDGVMQFRREPADVVITDLIMPGQEGIETIVALRKERPKLPIIAMSGGVEHSPVYLGLAKKLGAQRTLAKPFSGEELLKAIDEVLAEARGGEPV
ncbi:MAG: response regulator [Opitutaceae bacterium]|nr:response regulator [Opitutaceae bacterium]MBP9913491.1 response regulator [Opitutaceae bacterium]